MQAVVVENKERWEENKYGVNYVIEYALERDGDKPTVTLTITAQHSNFAHVFEVKYDTRLKDVDDGLWYFTHFTVTLYSVNNSKKKIWERIEIERLARWYDWPFIRKDLEKRIREAGVLHTIAEVVEYVQSLAKFSFPI